MRPAAPPRVSLHEGRAALQRAAREPPPHICARKVTLTGKDKSQFSIQIVERKKKRKKYTEEEKAKNKAEQHSAFLCNCLKQNVDE